MKEELIIKILDQSSSFLDFEKITALRQVLVEQLYLYEVTPLVTALVPANNMHDYVKLFLASKKIEGLSKHTLEAYYRHLKKLSVTLQKNMEDINTMDIRMYIANYSRKGVQQSTLETVMSAFRSFFNWMVANGYLNKSPMATIKRAKRVKKLRKELSYIELELLRDKAKTLRDKAIIEFFYSTGCRLDEVQKLNRSDIDWAAKKVVVFGKGSKERTVLLNAKAIVTLQAYLESRKDTSEALFVGERAPHKRLGRRAIQRLFNLFGKKAGINRSVHPHLLRHTTATHMHKKGVAISYIQRYLGHEDAATTQIYAHVDMDDVQTAFNMSMSA